MKVLFFDIGYTLVDESDVWERRCKEQAEFEESKKLCLTAKDIYNEIQKASILQAPQFLTVIDKYKFENIAPYRSELEKLYDEAPAVISALSKKYELGIIANQSSGLKKRLEEFGILKYFKYIISSGDVQIAKPDIRIFKYALNVAKCEPDEACMIGDRLDNDIYPAKCLGMKTVWIKQGFGALQEPLSEFEKSDYIVKNLSELLTIL